MASKPRVLLLSFYFPPYNIAGSLRLGKFAKYLIEFGFDVKVVTAQDQAENSNLEVEIPKECISYTTWKDVNALPKKFAGGSDKAYAITQSDEQYLSFKSRILLGVSKLYKTITNFPDSRIGWVKPAYNKSLEIIETWKPDVIYASSLPASVAILGHKLHSKTGIPWVCEFRDLWTLNHYYYYPKWRKFFEYRLEKKIVKTAAMTVTVSSGLSAQLKEAFGIESELFINGADFDVLKTLEGNTKVNRIIDSKAFNIIYTGSLYKGKRNPESVFQAVSELKAENSFDERLPVKIHFFGNDVGYTSELSNKYDLKDELTVHDMVTYETAIQAQLDADLLLLLLWNDPSEDGVLTSKLFEYMLAKRPILAVGRQNNEAVKLVNSNQLGVSGLEAKDFKEYIKSTYNKKLESGESIVVENDIAQQYSRESLSKKMAARLLKLIESK
jgi:glycosyltransferase involved in cell wall biosynthesis